MTTTPNPFAIPLGERTPVPSTTDTDHAGLIEMAALELDRQSPANAGQIARWIARNRPDVLRVSWTAGRVHIAGAIDDSSPEFQDCFDWGQILIDGLPQNLRRYVVGIAEYSSFPEEWEWCTLRSIERDLRDAMQRQLSSAGKPAHQCSDRANTCLCRAAGNLRPCTADAWGGERGTISGLLREPLTDADTDSQVL